MRNVVEVSTVESSGLPDAIAEHFKKGRYSEIMQLIGMHSTLIDPQHMLEDQNRLYRTVLNMIKNRVAGILGKKYSSWYADFPKIIDGIISRGEIVADKTSGEILESRRNGFGPFQSADDFFFWALDDRRLTLDHVVRYLERTAELHNG